MKNVITYRKIGVGIYPQKPRIMKVIFEGDPQDVDEFRAVLTEDVGVAKWKEE